MNVSKSRKNINYLLTFQKKDFFITLENGYPDDEEKEQILKIIGLFIIRIGEKLTQLYLISDEF